MTDNIIYGNPTKEFFIQMLTKDIPLIRAIIDLVDNSIDGAIRKKPDGNYGDLWVRIILNENEFIIEDNCGGIPLDIAKNYAFRFGRPKEAVATPKSVGLFGVGMKRAIFKMGRYFVVESETQNNSFVIEQDIDKWSEKPSWDFSFSETTTEKKDESGTRITVTKLLDNVTELFKLEAFVTELINQLEAAQQISLEKGISIKVNDFDLRYKPVKFYFSEELQPGYAEVTLEKYSEVDIKIFSGITDRNLEKGGWYLFCNSRLVLYADQSITTGWGESGSLPKYHPDFAFARGYIYFTSEDASLLPWNTTKTGVDTDSAIFQAAKQEMTKMMRPVTQWLRKLASEETDDGDLHQVLNEAMKQPLTISKLIQSVPEQHFKAPKPVRRIKPDEASIQYKMPRDRVEKVKEYMGADSNSDVGRQTFEYYYAMECDD